MHGQNISLIVAKRATGIGWWLPIYKSIEEDVKVG